MNLLAISFLILAGLALWHLFYEAILAPSLRQLLRYRLFAVRDSVRRLRMENPETFGHEAFGILNESLNNQIRLLGRVHASDLSAVNRAYDQDPSFRAEVDRRGSILSECPLAEAGDLNRQAAQLFVFGVMINSGGWLPYIIPVLLCLAGWDHLKKTGRIFVAAPDSGLSSLASA
ncbi:MAG: hypothetical protein JJU00_08465 [Opitutales bacterium]|nr:hypothetical protein [Opitutales bacterium]